MRWFSRGNVAEQLAYVRAGFRHAFTTRTDRQPLSIEDVELLERVADAIVKRGMAAPATVFLESLGPMSFLGSQALHFVSPIVEWAFNAREIEQVARLLERRDTIPRLIALIESKSVPRAPQGASPR